MGGPQGDNPVSTEAKEDESIISTTTFTTHFSVDIEGYADAVIVIRNDDASIDLNYRIYASADDIDTVPPDADDSWVNILDTNSNPKKYDHNEQKTIPPLTTFYESLSNKFRWIRLSTQAVSGTVATKCWFRGRNIN